MEMLPDSPPSPMAGVAAAREALTGVAETLWAAARPEDLLYVNVEIERLRSALGALQATVAVEVEVSDPPEERWIRRCRRASEQW